MGDMKDPSRQLDPLGEILLLEGFYLLIDGLEAELEVLMRTRVCGFGEGVHGAYKEEGREGGRGWWWKEDKMG